MRECCKKWSGLTCQQVNFLIENMGDKEVSVKKDDINFCPECAMPLTEEGRRILRERNRAKAPDEKQVRVIRGIGWFGISEK